MKWKGPFYVKLDISDIGVFYDIVTQKSKRCTLAFCRGQQTSEFALTFGKLNWTVLLQTFVFQTLIIRKLIWSWICKIFDFINQNKEKHCDCKKFVFVIYAEKYLQGRKSKKLIEKDR